MPALVLLVWFGLEIAAIVAVAGQIGVLATIGVVLVSCVLGGCLLRAIGLRAVASVQDALTGTMRPPRRGGGAIPAVAAVLLLVPGLISTALGLLLLVPPVRWLLGALAGRGLRRMLARAGFAGAAEAAPMRVRATREHPIVDGEPHQ